MKVPALFEDVTDSILKCAVAVHKGLGPGLPEYSYQKALELELNAAGISYVAGKTVIVRYRDAVVGTHRPDLIVEDKVLVELKAVASIDPVHTKQVLTYLRVTKLRVGLLLNFNVPTMTYGIKRFQL